MMEAPPASPFKMPKPDLLLELLIVALDAPAHFGEIDQTGEADVPRQRRKPIIRRLLLAFGPFDQQPFVRPGFAAMEVSFGNAHAQARKARSQWRVGSLAPGNSSSSLGWEVDSKLLPLDRPMRGITA